MITLEFFELKNLGMEMAELGAASYAELMAPAKDLISQRNAYCDYGEARVKRWVHQDMVNTVRSGNSRRPKVLYSRAELMDLDKQEKLNSIINK